MATNKILGTHLIGALGFIFKSGSYSPTAINKIDLASNTVGDLTLSSILNGAAVNSDQIDLGTSHAEEYSLKGALEWFAAVSAGGDVSCYWSPSNNSVVTDGNPGKPDGVDGAYTGDGGGTVAESVKQMQFIGAFITTDLQGVQIAEIGKFKPKGRFGQLIVVNNSGTTVCGTDDIESAIVMEAVVPDIQAAA